MPHYLTAAASAATNCDVQPSFARGDCVPRESAYLYFIADDRETVTCVCSQFGELYKQEAQHYRQRQGEKENMNSKFIVIEGLEGAGKTSAIAEVVDVLRQQKIRDVVFTREPGGTPLAEALRTLIKNSVGDEPVTDRAELLMLYAARVQLVEELIKPALARGAWVVGDRHDLSSQAYQGGGRGMDIRLLQTLRDTVLGKFRPDLTLYLDIPPALGLARARARSRLDRIEVESLAFFDRARARYRAIAATDAGILTIDASQPLAEVRAAIRASLTQWLRTQVLSP